MNTALAQYQALGILYLSARERPQNREIKALFNEALRAGDLNAVAGIYAAHPELMGERLLTNAMLIALESNHIHIVRYLRQQKVQAFDEALRAVAKHLVRARAAPRKVHDAENKAIALLDALMAGPHSDPVNARFAIGTAIGMDARRFLVALLKHFPQDANYAFCWASNPNFKDTRLILEVLHREVGVDLSSTQETLYFAMAAMPFDICVMPHDCFALRLALQCGANPQLLLPEAEERHYPDAVKILLANGATATTTADAVA